MNKIIVTNSEELENIIQASINTHFKKVYAVLENKLSPKKSKLNVKEVAEILDVTDLTVRNYIKKGIICAEKIGRRILIDRIELEKSLKKFKSLKYQRL